ncbi:hypothetical protein NLG97_g4286 [Lecanicillium saksenae]|uniref:Uncharacterized protein n=1 Tax=Lecanicillium saksenae TaxID=468837 RepID=A0ACC1QYW1_9HYPO|nr:hypothetical protein NLG97_g4286 [Lecanicillium saksenae]
MAARPPFSPGAFIVEFQPGQNNKQAQDAVTQDASVRIDLNSELFQGISIQLNDVNSADEKAEKLKALPAVKNIWPVRQMPRPNPEVDVAATNAIRAILDKDPKAAEQSAGQTVSQRDIPAETLTSAQRMCQIEKLREKGYRGRGIKIAVVDTGIDYLHPALGKCFGEGCLVSYGYDLVGDAYGSNGNFRPVPDNDPMDCGGHGSHVAGIIAAQQNIFNFTGVAPDVTLGAYKVFGCEGSVGTDVLISAFNKAYQAGSDIISASIGGPSGWVDEPWAQAVSRIVARGVPCTIAAGNEGATGIFYPSSGSTGKGAVAVASFENTDIPTLTTMQHYTVDGGEPKAFPVTPSASKDGWDSAPHDLWAASYDTTKADDGCKPFPADTPDLSDKIVLIRRGTCAFSDKLNNAAAFGAKYVIIYNNQPESLDMALDNTPKTKAATLISVEAGATFIDLLKAGKKVRVTMDPLPKLTQTLSYAKNNAIGGGLSLFTTWGPTWELYAKPDVGAPGGKILSTFPRAKGSYIVYSGTSMATPFTAASVALLLEIRGKKLAPAAITNLLSSNANPQLFNAGSKFEAKLAPVAQQGAGLIQVYDSAFATTLLEPSNLAFNQTANLNSKLNFKISNTGKESITYDIDQVSAYTVYALGTSGTKVLPFPNPAVDAYAKLGFSNNKVTIAAGSSASVDVTVTPPEGVDAKRLPVWSGYVTINGTDGTSLSLPYQGVSGSLKEHAVVDPDASWISYSDDKNRVPVPENTTFALPVPGKATGQERLPQLVVNMSLGSRNITAHLQPMTTCPPKGTYEYKGFKTIGQPFDFPALFNSRELFYDAWDGQLNTGDYAPPGKYRMIVRALRVFGDPNNDKDWDVTVGPRFVIKYGS